MNRPRRSGKFVDFLLEGMWTEGFGLFLKYWRNWWLGVAVFSTITIALDYLTKAIGTNPYSAVLKILAVAPFETYFFCMCFLHQEPITGTATPSAKQFFSYYGYTLSGAIIGGGIYAAADVYLDIFRELATSTTSVIPMASLEILVVCRSILIYFIIIKMAYIPILSANGIPEPFWLGWKITRNKVFRIFINLLTMNVLLSPLQLIVNKGSIIPSDIASTLLECANTAFFCATARILYNENIVANLTHDRRTEQRAPV